MKKMFYVMLLVSLVVLVSGCAKEKTEDKNIQTIQTYLEKEFTGPNEEVSAILDKDPHGSEIEEYVKANYEPLVSDVERMVSTNFVLAFIRFAHEFDYQLKPVNIKIEKSDGADLYDYEVIVEYIKKGETKKATVTGTINVDEDGKISSVRNMKDSGLLDEIRN